MSSRKNKFSSALRHLNSSQIDEKIKKLEEQPTNNTSGIYTLSPPDPAADPTVYTPSYHDITVLTPDFAIGEDPANATQAADTSGLFNAEGVSLTAAPPGDNSYILGPMSTMYYSWASRTQIGYIRQADRRMVNLGWISGNFGDWDGNEAAFNSYGQLTLEQAQWYRTIGKKDGANNSTENYRAFYPGPPSSVADSSGRYLCTITGEPKDVDDSSASSTSGPKNGPLNPNDNYSAQRKKDEDKEEDKKKDDKDKSEDEKQKLLDKIAELNKQSKALADTLNASGVGQDQAAVGAIALAPWAWNAIVTTGLGAAALQAIISSYNARDYVYQSSTTGDDILWRDDPAGQQAQDREQDKGEGYDKAREELGNALKDAQRAGNEELANEISDQIGKMRREKNKRTKERERAEREAKNQADRERAAAKEKAAKAKAEREYQEFLKKLRQQQAQQAKGSQTDSADDVANLTGGWADSYKPRGLNLSESKSRIMKTLKEPVVLPEGKKKSYKVRPGRRGKTDFKGMDKLIGDTKIEKTFKEPQDIWSKDWHGYNQRVSQGKKNVVLELIGQSTDAFNYMLTDSKKMNAKQMEEFWGLHPEMHSHFYNGKKYKTVRKEELKGDRLVFLLDEKGVKTSILQSKLNDQLAQEHDQELLDEYNKLNPKKESIEYKKDPLIKKVMGRLKNEIDYPDKPARKGYPNKPPPKMVNGMHPKFGKHYKYDKLDSVSAVMMSRAPTGDPEIDANVRKAARKPK